MTRYVTILVLFVAAAGLPYRFIGPAAAPDTAPEAVPERARGAFPDRVPEAVRAAAEEGRYWRASRILSEYLEEVADTTPSEILLAARLDAGWDNWDGVHDLLEGRAWLGTEGGGEGLELLGRSQVELGRFEQGAETLERYLSLPGPAGSDDGLTRLRRGLALSEAGRSAEAMESLGRAAERLPELGDWIALYAAEAAAAGGDTAAVGEWLAEAGSLARGSGWRLRVRGLLEAGDSLAAREVALETARTAGSSGRRAAAWERLGQLRLAAGDTARAREALAQAIDAVGTIAAVDAARTLTELSPSPEQRLAIGRVYARHGNATRAAEGFRAYLDSGLGSATERARVRLELGEARFNAGRYGQAERGLLELADDGVAPGIAAQAMYLAARARYRQGRVSAGQETFARLAERFPDQPAAARGLYLLADLKHDELAIEEARRYYREAVEASPDLNEAGLAMMRLGGLAALEEDWAGALEIFEEYRARHPDGRRWAQATYWAARSLEALGRADSARVLLRELRERDPVSYHGVLAAERLNEPVLALAGAAAPATGAAADSAIEAGMRRVDLLAALGRRDDVVTEVERLRERYEDDTDAAYALAEALTRRGYTLTAIGMGWDLYRRTGEWNDRLLRIIYPFPYQNLVLPESLERGLDPYLVAGLIRRESAFNPTVSSGAGAIGLMQIMPPTGRTLARAVGIEGYETGLLRQPEVNVHLGTRYFAEMLDRYDGDLPLALSAYNAGPTRARVWREMPEARDPELFTERIPYSETREYVRNVLLHRALYRALYPELGAGAD